MGGPGDGATVWSDEIIDALFDIGPDHDIPGSKMPVQGLAAPSDWAGLNDCFKNATRVE